MEKTDNMPIWVFLAYSSINTRKAALWLIRACVAFSVYCVQDWVGTIFLIDDWSWLAMMVPITFWYWISLRWLDNHSGWETVPQGKD